MKRVLPDVASNLLQFAHQKFESLLNQRMPEVDLYAIDTGICNVGDIVRFCFIRVSSFFPRLWDDSNGFEGGRW